MYVFSIMIGLVVYLIALLKVFNVRNHPFTSLAFSGAVSYAIVAVELLRLTEGDWKLLITLPLAIGSAWFSTRQVQAVSRTASKSLVLYSLLSLGFAIVYFSVFNISFLIPLLLMAIVAVLVVPRKVKEERRRLFTKTS